MKKKIILVIVTLIFLLSTFTSCNSNEQVDVKQQSNSLLSKGTVVKLDNFSFKFLKSYLIKTEGDNFKDIEHICPKISDTSYDSTKLGFDIGFNNSKSEVSKRDGYLLLKLNYNPDKKITSQRNSVIPTMDISAVDNKGDDVILIHNSMDDKYINVKKSIGILLFKIFADAKTVDFTFDGNTYKLKLK